MSYIVIKTVKGRKYRYEQWSWREGKKVKTKSRCLGPVDGGTRGGGASKGLIRRVIGFVQAQGPLFRVGPDEEEMLKQHNDKVARERQAREQVLIDLHERLGLTIGGAGLKPVADPASVALIQVEMQEEAPAVAGAEVQ